MTSPGTSKSELFQTPWSYFWDPVGKRFPPGGGKGISEKLVSAMSRVPPAKILPIIDWPKAVTLQFLKTVATWFWDLVQNRFPPGGGKGIPGNLVVTMSRKSQPKKLSVIDWPKGVKNKLGNYNRGDVSDFAGN